MDLPDSQRLLIRILGYQLFGGTKPSFENVDWSSLLAEAKKQAVFPLVFSCVEDELRQALSAQEFLAYEQRNAGFYSSAIRSRYDHDCVHKLLTQHGVPYVILKGQATARYYPDPYCRSMGDVDVLVEPDNLDKVGSLLTAEGFREEEGSWRHPFHRTYLRHKTEVEVHWAVPGLPSEENEALKRCLSGILTDAVLVEEDDCSFLMPSPFHHGLILLLHTLSHQLRDGIGLRHLCDWLVFEDSFSDEAFRSLFQKPLQEIGLWTFAQVLTSVGIRFFGCAPKAWCAGADDQLCEDYLMDIASSGNFGGHNRTRLTHSRFYLNPEHPESTSDHFIKTGLAAVGHLARKRYPKLAKNPILFPIGCGFVVIPYLYRMARGKRVNPLKKDFRIAVSKRESLYSRLRLFKK